MLKVTVYYLQLNQLMLVEVWYGLGVTNISSNIVIGSVIGRMVKVIFASRAVRKFVWRAMGDLTKEVTGVAGSRQRAATAIK